MRRALLILGWIAVMPGLVGLLGVALVFSDAPALFGCRTGAYFRIDCAAGPIGALGELLWTSGLMMLIGFPYTLVPCVYTVVFPIVRLVLRGRAASSAA